MIVDFDVHHGNGTQDIFYDDPRVLYLSTHQHGIYPGTGKVGETGSMKAPGTTINIPLPAFTGDSGFNRVFDQIIEPVARRFEPQILLISAGYDAHWQDPLAQLQLTTSGYSQLSNRLVALADEICDGRIVSILEGGYNPVSLFEGILTGVAAMTGRDYPGDLSGSSGQFQEPEIGPVIEAVVQQHKLQKMA